MRNVSLKTKDRQRIEATHYGEGGKKVVILAHGFFNAKDAYLFQGIAKALALHYDVVAFDFRGHGKSSGLFTWTTKEGEDLKAVTSYVKKEGYTSIALMGFSLGAAICLIEGAEDTAIKTVIAVSSPSDFWKINYRFWKPGMLDDLKLNLGFKAKGKGVRPSHPWGAKTAPIDIVTNISPRAVLCVHGAEDWLIDASHSQELYKKAKEPKKLVILKKLGHAEMMFDQAPDLLMKPCLEWLKETL